MSYASKAELPDMGQTDGQHFPQELPEELVELAKILAAHPGGLRRWSVMRAIRSEREKSGREVPQKLEDDVERQFRRHCADVKGSTVLPEEALFYRPREKAGEVWAAYPERVRSMLANNDNDAA